MIKGVFLSLIIPTRNRPSQLGRLLESLLPQMSGGKARPVEVIVVDDASDGDARGAYKKIIRESGPRLKLLSAPKPLGPAGARNRGIEAARGEVLAFLDDDMVPDPSFLAELIRFHRDHPDILVVNGNLKKLRRDIYSDFWYHYYSARFNVSGRSLYRVARVASGNFSIKRTVLRSLSPLFDPGLAAWEDLDLAFRLRTLGIPVYKCDLILARHDVRSSLRAFLAQKAWFDVGRAQFLRKHGPAALKDFADRAPVPRKLKFLPLYAAQRAARWRKRLGGSKVRREVVP
jgi:glycosyltransferase involved in cell wall biosynthesis